MKTLNFLLVWAAGATIAVGLPPSHPPSTTAAVKQPKFTFEKLHKLHTTFTNQFLYPADIAQAKSINSTLLAENVQGRIDITRTFEGRELNTEYLFGLFSNIADNPNAVSLLGLPMSYEMLHFVATDYISSAAIRFMFNFASLGLTVPIEIDSWITWNHQGQISQYDITFKYWQWMLDYVIGASAAKLNATTPAEAVGTLTKLLASGVCQTAQTHCTGENQQYSDAAACYEFLTQKIRFGSAYELGRNTLLCRTVHQNMVPFRPSVHCSHIGPTGGGMCADDKTYTGTVLDNYFKIPFIPPHKSRE